MKAARGKKEWIRRGRREEGRERVAALLPFCKRAACMPKEEEKGTQECGRRGLAELEVGTQKYSLERQRILEE